MVVPRGSAFVRSRLSGFTILVWLCRNRRWRRLVSNHVWAGFFLCKRLICFLVFAEACESGTSAIGVELGRKVIHQLFAESVNGLKGRNLLSNSRQAETEVYRQQGRTIRFLEHWRIPDRIGQLFGIPLSICRKFHS